MAMWKGITAQGISVTTWKSHAGQEGHEKENIFCFWSVGYILCCACGIKPFLYLFKIHHPLGKSAISKQFHGELGNHISFVENLGSLALYICGITKYWYFIFMLMYCFQFCRHNHTKGWVIPCKCPVMLKNLISLLISQSLP